MKNNKIWTLNKMKIKRILKVWKNSKIRTIQLKKIKNKIKVKLK